MYKNISIVLAILLFTQLSASAQKLTREEYIIKYQGIVIEHQDIYGIPASIKMAQALLESSNGNSRLAVQANNHFGIKCKSTWKGNTIFHDDDEKDECFRNYSSSVHSFKDHSEFLDGQPRYQSLFKLDADDYKAWAHGLKKAGYATNPKYASLLITIIEDYDLHLLDKGQKLSFNASTSSAIEEIQDVKDVPKIKINLDNYVVTMSTYEGYPLYSNNKSEFIIAKDNEKFSSLSKKLKISERKLRKYNDMPEGDVEANSIVYVRNKTKRMYNGKLMHYVKDGETIHSISQLYGIRLKNLRKINNFEEESRLTIGQQIRLM